MMSYLAEYYAVPEADPAERVQRVSAWIRTQPQAFFAELRQQQPILRTPAFTLVTRYKDVVDVLRRSTEFSVRIYAQRMDDAVGPYMLGRDHAVQNKRDKPFMQSMLPCSDFPNVRRIIREYLSDILPATAAEVDIVQSLGHLLPLHLCSTYFGFPGPDVESMLRWSKATQIDFFKNLAGDQAIHQAAMQAGSEMKSYLADLVQARMTAFAAQPDRASATVLDHLVRLALADRLPFEPSELVVNMAGLLIGSIETTSQAIVQATEQILLRPEILQQATDAAIADNMDLLTAFAREALRFNPINPLLFRFTESEALLAGGSPYAQRVPRGTIVFACTASAMWDECMLRRADEFRIDRPDDHYLHFGFGEHLCLGDQLGELMLVEALAHLLQRGVRRVAGPRGDIDFAGGPFPERYLVQLQAAGDRL